MKNIIQLDGLGLDKINPLCYNKNTNKGKEMIQMKKQYKVEGFSEMMDAEMNCATVEQASDIFEMIANSDLYHRGHIIDNYTGEVYSYFEREVEGNGIKLVYWTAFN